MSACGSFTHTFNSTDEDFRASMRKKTSIIEQHAIFGVVDNRENGINYDIKERKKAFFFCVWEATYLQLRLSVFVCSCMPVFLNMN